MKELSASIFQEIEEFRGKNQAEKLQKRHIQSTSWTNDGLCLLILVVFGKLMLKISPVSFLVLNETFLKTNNNLFLKMSPYYKTKEGKK